MLAHLPRCQHEHKTSAEQEGARGYEVGKGPVYFIGKLHPQQWDQQYKPCRERNPENDFALRDEISVFCFHRVNHY